MKWSISNQTNLTAGIIKIQLNFLSPLEISPLVEKLDQLNITFMGAELLLQGLDGAYISNKTLDFLRDI